MTISEKVVEGLDASRRAGWRAYFEAKNEVERLRAQLDASDTRDDVALDNGESVIVSTTSGTREFRFAVEFDGKAFHVWPDADAVLEVHRYRDKPLVVVGARAKP